MDMEIDNLEDFNQTDVKTETKRFLPKRNVQSKRKVLPKKEKVESNVEVKTEKVESVDDKKAESIAKVKTEKVELVEIVNVDMEDSKISVEDGGEFFNVVEERVASKDVDMEEMENKVEEDYVIREIDVYLSLPPGDAQYNVVQYPLRPTWRPYEFHQCLKKIRIKPKTSQHETQLEIDIHHDYPSSSQQETQSRKQTLTSSTNSSSKVNHSFGVLHDNKLYVCPVKAVHQMRPKMEFAEDDMDWVIEENVDGHGTERAKDTVGKHPVASSKDQGKAISSQTHNTVAEEPWIPLKYHNYQSEASAECLKNLMTANQSEISSTMSEREYLNSFFPKKQKDNVSQKIRSLRSLPLEEGLKKWLCEGQGNSQAFRFSVLKHLAPEVSTEDFLNVLEKYADLVQGLWVPKTSTLLPDCEATDCKALARNFVILKFSHKLNFTDAELEAYEELMQKSLKEAFNGLGIYSKVLKSWKFKEPADPSFEKLYPSVAIRQKKVLEALALEILPQMKRHLKNKGGTKRSAWFPVKKQEALLKALGVLFKSHSVHSLETIVRGLRDMAVSASSIQNTVDKNWMTVAATCVNAPEELKGVICEFTTMIHDVYVAKSSLTSIELNPLRDVVIKLFNDHPPNGKLKKAHIMKVAEQFLNIEVSDNDFHKVMSELCDSSSNGWMVKRPR